MVLLMLGITLVTIVALVVWLRTPEQLFIHQLNDETTVIQGGESVMTLARYIRRELVSSVLLISAGISGILVARRPESHSCGSHL